MSEGDVPDDEGVVPIGVANTLREGADLTIVSWSKMARLADEAAETLAGDGASVEVIDLRTLWPWDTGGRLRLRPQDRKLLVAQEAVQVGGFAAEIATDVTEHCADAAEHLRRRIGAPRMPVPYANRWRTNFASPPNVSSRRRARCWRVRSSTHASFETLALLAPQDEVGDNPESHPEEPPKAASRRMHEFAPTTRNEQDGVRYSAQNQEKHMKLMTFDAGNGARVGLVNDNGVVDLTERAGATSLGR